MGISVPLGLLEREAELRRLRNLLHDAAARRGSVVLVEGPTGIGKTRLLQTTCEDAATRGLRVLTARGSDLEREFAFGVVRQLFEPVVVRPDGGSKESLFAGIASYAVPVFGRTEVAAELDEPSDRSVSVLHGLYWLTYNLAERGPLLIAVDDAHWADCPSLLFLDYLGRRLGGLPLAVVLSYRRGQSGPEADLVRRIATDRPGRVLELRPLSAEGTGELVRSLLGADTAEELCQACYTATGGNPFLVHELAAGLISDGVLAEEDAAARVGRLVPDAVARHVLVRLSRLGPASMGVARAVAVLGGGTGLRLVAALAGLGEAETAEAVDALVSADILAAGVPLAFAHPLIGEAVYADSRPGERALAHARAAHLLGDAGSPPERVALQLLASEPAQSAWAVATLRAAARDASARGAPESAARYLQRALAELPGAGDRRTLLAELGVAEARAARPRAAEHLAEALRLAEEPVGRARIAQELAGLYNLLGRFGESADVLEEAIDGLAESEQELRFSLEAEAAVLAVTVLEARHRLGARMAAFRVSAPGIAALAVAAPLLAVIAYDLADADASAGEAARYAERAFADDRLLGREGPVLPVGAAAFVVVDRPARAETILDAAVTKARARGSINATRVALAVRAFARNRRGRIAEAEADARLSLELSMDGQPDPVRPFKVAQLAEALIDRGELAEAERLLASSELQSSDAESKLFQPLACSRGRLLVLRGRFREALAVLDLQLARMEKWGCRNAGWTSARSLAALAHRGLQSHDDARALAADDLAAASTFGAPRALGIALRTSAVVAEGPQLELLRDSAAVLEGSEARLELATTLVELGSALRRTGARRDAREPLRRGLELAQEAGGTLLAERARAELLASGSRPRRASARDDGLTPSELRVATMAKDGLSNREIAQGLFLSQKTVEMHLSHVYRKLRIHARTHLAGALGNTEDTGR